MSEDFGKLAAKYKGALLDDVLPFWLRHSLDEKHGGYLTCLDHEGKAYDTDKFVWLQAREAWTFSALCNRLEEREEWLRAARLGIDFLKRHGRDADGNWYFSLRQDGEPTVEAYNIFSDCFAAAAFGQYALAAGDEECAEIALATYRSIWRRKENPKGRFSKAARGARPLVPLALAMILVNLTLEMEAHLPEAEREQALDGCLREILEVCRDRERGIIYENAAPDGSHPDCLDGRLYSPGHGIEATWFVMDVARRRGDAKLALDAVETALAALERGWDPEHGGIFYFLDAEGQPPDRLDWDQKLWWVHLEALVALSMGYAVTEEERCLDWLRRVDEWAWARFPDPEFGEWWGYLNRRGEVLLSCKGGKWKGCFHVPRALWMVWKELETLSAR